MKTKHTIEISRETYDLIMALLIKEFYPDKITRERLKSRKPVRRETAFSVESLTVIVLDYPAPKTGS